MGYDGKQPVPEEGELMRTTRKNDIFGIKLSKLSNLYNPPSQNLDETRERKGICVAQYGYYIKYSTVQAGILHCASCIV
jgi:hypothetical protein